MQSLHNLHSPLRITWAQVALRSHAFISTDGIRGHWGCNPKYTYHKTAALIGATENDRATRCTYCVEQVEKEQRT